MDAGPLDDAGLARLRERLADTEPDERWILGPKTVAALLARLDAAEAGRDRLRSALLLLLGGAGGEWGSRYAHAGGGPEVGHCPWCCVREPGPHQADCELLAARAGLARLRHTEAAQTNGTAIRGLIARLDAAEAGRDALRAALEPYVLGHTAGLPGGACPGHGCRCRLCAAARKALGGG